MTNDDFAIGDRVRMRSALVDTTTGKPGRLLHGTIEAWGGGMIVRWDDWPCMTALPNPNVERDA